MRYVGLFLAILTGGISGDSLEIIRTIPHSGYSEGLDYFEGYLWHALPKEILKIDPKDGQVLERHSPPSEYSESLAWFEGNLWNLSFSTNGIYRGKKVGNRLALSRVGNTPELHGWGITHDGKSLIVTGNYSPKLYFVSPKTLRVEREITTPVRDLEDLAYDGIGIWTSSFSAYQGQIFRVDPGSGQMSPFFSLPKPEDCPVIDGIAFDGTGLWITGKNCTHIYYSKKPLVREITKK